LVAMNNIRATRVAFVLVVIILCRVYELIILSLDAVFMSYSQGRTVTEQHNSAT
jgi:hypothetical protein